MTIDAKKDAGAQVPIAMEEESKMIIELSNNEVEERLEIKVIVVNELGSLFPNVTTAKVGFVLL